MSKSKVKEQKIELGKYHDRYCNNYQLNYGKYHVKVMYETSDATEEDAMDEFTFEHIQRKEPDGLDYITVEHKKYGINTHNAGYVLANYRYLSISNIQSIIMTASYDIDRQDTIDALKYRVSQVAAHYILKGKCPFTSIYLCEDRVRVTKLGE